MSITQRHTHHPGIVAPEAARLYDGNRAELIDLFLAGASPESRRDEAKLDRELAQVKILERELVELGDAVAKTWAPTFQDAPHEWLIRIDTLCMLYARIVGNNDFLNPFVLMAISPDGKHFEAISDWKDEYSPDARSMTGFIRGDLVVSQQRVRIPVGRRSRGFSTKRVLWQNLPVTLKGRLSYYKDRSMDPHLIHPDLVGEVQVSGIYVGDLCTRKGIDGPITTVKLSKHA